MPTWEYLLVVRSFEYGNDYSLDRVKGMTYFDMLNTLGREGWELIDWHEYSNGTQWTFKRPIEG